MNGLGFITSQKNNLCLWCIQLNRKHYGTPNPFVESSIVRRIVHRSSDRPIVRRIVHPFTRSHHPGLGMGLSSLVFQQCLQLFIGILRTQNCRERRWCSTGCSRSRRSNRRPVIETEGKLKGKIFWATPIVRWVEV